MHNTGPGGHDEHVLVGGGAPLEECEALLVALKFECLVLGGGIGGASKVDLDRVVNHKVRGHKRVDLIRIPPESVHGVSHGREIHHGRNTGEILHDDSGRLEGNLSGILTGLLPVENILDVLFLDFEIVVVSQSRFKKDSDRVGELLHSGVLQSREGVVIHSVEGHLGGFETFLARHCDVRGLSLKFDRFEGTKTGRRSRPGSVFHRKLINQTMNLSTRSFLCT
mmetsp:Transcript_36324/g.71468  ORF Transcript_36324/g.71468 Transcript_36324/m.71468 type:complete len:224 (+) Transcript_36324:3664-4335(+)